MTDTENVEEIHYCSATTFRATRYQPAEGCEEEVDNEGDLCSGHQQEEDGPDPDDERDRWLEDRYERDYERDYCYGE